MCACMLVYAYVCACAGTNVCVQAGMCPCVCLCVHIRVCVCGVMLPSEAECVVFCMEMGICEDESQNSLAWALRSSTGNRTWNQQEGRGETEGQPANQHSELES